MVGEGGEAVGEEAGEGGVEEEEEVSAMTAMAVCALVADGGGTTMAELGRATTAKGGEDMVEVEMEGDQEVGEVTMGPLGACGMEDPTREAGRTQVTAGARAEAEGAGEEGQE